MFCCFLICRTVDTEINTQYREWASVIHLMVFSYIFASRGKLHSAQADWKIYIVYATLNVWTEILLKESSPLLKKKDEPIVKSCNTDMNGLWKGKFLSLFCPFSSSALQSSVVFLNTELLHINKAGLFRLSAAPASVLCPFSW